MIESGDDRTVRVSANSPFEIFRAVAAYENAKRDKERPALIDAVKQPPVPESILQKLIWLPQDEADRIFKEHPGHDLNERVQSVFAALAVFRRALASLRGNLSRFETVSSQRDFLSRGQIGETETIVDDICTDVFCLSGAAFALVEQTRHMDEIVSRTTRDTWKAEIFDECENQFVLGLRRNLHHVRFAKPSWLLSLDRQQNRSAKFRFRCSELAYGRKFNEKAREFMTRSGAVIDVMTLFESYAARVEKFYGRLRHAIKGTAPIALADYRRCFRARVNNASRVSLKLVLTPFSEKKGDPYPHLWRFLSSAQLAEVLAMPHRSREQVDRIIELADPDSACDAELRALVYRIFNIDREKAEKSGSE